MSGRTCAVFTYCFVGGFFSLVIYILCHAKMAATMVHYKHDAYSAHYGTRPLFVVLIYLV